MNPVSMGCSELARQMLVFKAAASIQGNRVAAKSAASISGMLDMMAVATDPTHPDFWNAWAGNPVHTHHALHPAVVAGLVASGAKSV
ncbi:MAG: hypothetical protein AAF658_21900 [Myxococcota bacterium]